jgi:para-aminobenzoate synthetase
VYLLALAPLDDPAAATRWLEQTRRRLEVAATRPLAPPGAYAARVGEPRLRHDRDRYLGMIDRCLTAIEQGESYEVCLTNQVEVAAAIDPWPAYRALRRDNPVPFGALLRLGDLAVLSTSPERFLSISAAGEVESRPIKGTRPRGDTPELDELLRKELATSEKDRAENVMIVDLVRNDLGSCAEVGSVRVTRIFEVESYATVHQLVSTIRARLAPDCSPVRCVRAAFPGGSMTGAPKIRTMELLDELEWSARGIYSGVLGYLTIDGRADLSVVIRTAVMTPDSTMVGAGGAIVLDSDPDAEYDEMVLKATATIRGRTG